MKKLAYIAIAALAALTACTKVDMPQTATARKVTFQAASYVPRTKANSSVLGEFTSFTCKAFLHADGYQGDGQVQAVFGDGGTDIYPYDSQGNMLTGAVSEAGVSYWAPGRDYYWPKSSDSYINFVAWYGQAPSTATETSLSWTCYQDSPVGSSDKLLYADEAWRYTNNTANGGQYTGDAVTSGVPMLFRHALAQLCFKAKTSNAPSGGNISRSVSITRFSLSGVYDHGVLTLTNSEPDGTGAAVNPWTAAGNVWTTEGSATSIEKTTTVNPVAAGVDLIAQRTVLPQAVTDGMLVNLTYKVTTTVTGGSTTFSSEETVRLENKRLNELVPGIAAWQMGYSITYTLDFDLSADTITISPSLADWSSTIGGGSVAVE